MLNKEYDILLRRSKERFVLVPEKDYKAMLALLEDEEDYRILEAAIKCNAGKPTIPHERIMREFGLTPGRKKRKP